MDKLKTRANETQYWKKHNDNNNTTNNKIDWGMAIVNKKQNKKEVDYVCSGIEV